MPSRASTKVPAEAIGEPLTSGSRLSQSRRANSIGPAERLHMRAILSRFYAAALAGAVLACAVVAPATGATRMPTPDHVVVVMEENHGFSQIIGSKSAPYINSLASQGALFTHSRAIQHPSEPNYLELFSGSNQGVNDDSCPHSFA